MVFTSKKDERAFSDVFNKNYEPLCLYSARFTEDIIEAEDVVQEVFLRFWENYGKNLDPDKARPLLYRMAKNICIDRARGKKWNRVHMEAVAEKLEYFFQPESEDDSKIDLLMSAINQLPDKCRQVLVSVCVNEKKYKEVAEEMQVSVNTVKTQLARALKLLRESLDKGDFELFLTFFTFSR